MATLNKPQQQALKRVFDRAPIIENDKRISYREFRKSVQIGRDYAMIKWAGMWLGIELDGYTHS